MLGGERGVRQQKRKEPEIEGCSPASTFAGERAGPGGSLALHCYGHETGRHAILAVR